MDVHGEAGVARCARTMLFPAGIRASPGVLPVALERAACRWELYELKHVLRAESKMIGLQIQPMKLKVRRAQKTFVLGIGVVNLDLTP